MTKRDKLEGGLHRFGADVVLRARPRARLFDGLAREDTEWDRDWEGRGELGKGPRDCMGEYVEVRGLTSDQAAKRDDGVETAGSGEHRDRRWQLERAGDVELLDLCGFGERRLEGTAGERTCDLIVPARAHDRYARARVRILHPGRSLPRGRHMPQSSPRMHCRSVTG